MTLFMIRIPFMPVAVGIAVIPLLVMSRKELRHIASEFERHREQRSRAHHGRRQHEHDGRADPHRNRPGSAHGALTPIAHDGCRKERSGTTDRPVPKLEMALFIISVPLMVAAVATAVIPLIAVSHKHHRRTATQTGMPVRMNVATEPRHDEESALPIAA